MDTKDFSLNLHYTTCFAKPTVDLLKRVLTQLCGVKPIKSVSESQNLETSELLVILYRTDRDLNGRKVLVKLFYLSSYKLWLKRNKEAFQTFHTNLGIFFIANPVLWDRESSASYTAVLGSILTMVTI